MVLSLAHLPLHQHLHGLPDVYRVGEVLQPLQLRRDIGGGVLPVYLPDADAIASPLVLLHL